MSAMSKYKVKKDIDKMKVGMIYTPTVGAYIYLTDIQLKYFRFEDYFEPIEEEERCNSPYHFDLQKLDGYGRDELRSALDDIIEELTRKS